MSTATRLIDRHIHLVKENKLMRGLISSHLCRLTLIAIPCSLLLFCIDYAYPTVLNEKLHIHTGLFNFTAYFYIVGIGVIAFFLAYILHNYQIERRKALLLFKDLAEANESKNKLLSILSHDLKAPLNSIKGFLEVLSEYGLSEEDKFRIQSQLLKETKNTQSMLENMLSWAKSQMDGGITSAPEYINLSETLETCVAIHHAAAVEKNITLHNDINPSTWVFADQEMIRLVVRNLLNNAVKFTREGGEISVASKVVEDSAVIIVKDNGIGIPLEKQADLFGHKSCSTYGTANEKGVGLGLKLCKEFAELQNGDLSFQSSAAGTVFLITLPLHQSQVSQQQTVPVQMLSFAM